ncbi:hypothetical protein B0H14DRAFT_2711846 [Mycena olivaceomarginata]|nr:hypothetical protein B0H14DRAFT_2711846 [Mycena olivaceomarginata]
MGDQLEDARSAIFKDKNGITLACVFAHRIPGVQKMHGVSYPGPEGRTLMDVLGTHDEAHYDGLNACASFCSTPITPERDVRHNEDDKYMVYIPDGSTSEKSERAGVTHLVQCWTMQGHPVRVPGVRPVRLP